LLFEDPVAGVFQNEHGGVGGDEFHLLAEESAVGFFTADGQDGHGEFGLREHGEIFGGLREGNEVRPAGTHASRASVGGGVSHTIGFGDGMGFVGGEVVPEVFIVDAFPSLNQRFRCGTVETEMPDAGLL